MVFGQLLDTGFGIEATEFDPNPSFPATSCHYKGVRVSQLHSLAGPGGSVATTG